MDFLRRGLLFTAQFARQPLLSAAQLAGCYLRHSLDFPGQGCYSRHRAKPLLFTAHFRLSAQNRCCYRRHSLVLGCYSRHNLQGLLSAAHLAEKPANPRLLVIDTPLHFCAGVVIHGTVSSVVKHGTVWEFSCCYLQHILFLGCYSRHNSEKSSVVIHDTVSAWVVILGTVVVGCKCGHNLWWLCAEFQRLLFTAQFGIFVGGLLCCAQFSLVLLSLAQFAPLLGTAHCFSAHSCVVMPGTKPLLRPTQFGCYPRHSSSYFLK